MRITESKLRRIIRSVIIESKRFTTPHRGNVSKEELRKNFEVVIKSQTNLYDMISYYTEKNEEIPSEVMHAFGVIISAMYEKSFPVELNRDDKRYIKNVLVSDLMSSYPHNITIEI